MILAELRASLNASHPRPTTATPAAATPATGTQLRDDGMSCEKRLHVGLGEELGIEVGWDGVGGLSPDFVFSLSPCSRARLSR